MTADEISPSAPSTDAPTGAAAPEAGMAERMRAAHVELRSDLIVARHVFRGEVSYVIQDPLTFQSHRFAVGDYRLLSLLRSDRSLGDSFEAFVAAGHLDAGDEERFYQFVFSLHRFGFLKLPVSDDGTLYRRHVAKREQRAKGRAKSILFLPIPLWNPDRFLTRTLPYVKPLCTRAAFAVWCGALALALAGLVANWSDFRRPVADIFSGDNLPLLWISLVVLKVVHEFGHAYATKHFGGHVPEMGVMLVLFTPCAFVDATSSWTFPRKRDRLVVNMAGMYVELFVAALALILWCVTPPGVWRQCLHNVVLLASVVTIGFNLNPLMRYDGYYALADLVEVPNLRARSQQYATAVLKKLVLAVPIQQPPGTPGLRLGLLAFGIAGTLYKVTLVVGISAAIAMKFLFGGLLLGGLYFGGELVRLVRTTLPYLWSSEEVAARRVRARLLSVGLACGVPLMVAGVPIPSRVKAPGVVVGSSQSTLRAGISGFLDDVTVRPGDTIAAGAPIVRLDEPDKRANLAMAEARLDATRIRQRVFEVTDRALAAEEGVLAAHAEREVEHLRDDLAKLDVADEVGGIVLSCPHPSERGRLVRRGEELAVVSRGRPLVRALLTADELAAARPHVGMAVEFRAEDDPRTAWAGTIRRIEPVGSTALAPGVLEHLDKSEFSLNPMTGEASRSHFEVQVELEVAASERIHHGSSGRLGIGARAETLGRLLYRRVVGFVGQL